MKVLVIVDMQNDNIDGVLGTKEAQAIVPKIVAKIKDGAYDYKVILYDTHDEKYLETQEGKKLPIVHTVKGTDGWQLNKDIDKVTRNSKCCRVNKKTFGSVYINNTLNDIERLENAEITEIEFVGVCTDICVISNVLITKAFRPEVKITVDSDCCAGVTPESHDNALKALKACQIDVI